MSLRSILVLYNQPVLPREHPDAESEHSVIEVAGEIARTLQEAGYTVAQFGLGADPRTLWNTLLERKPDVVFNLYEGNADNPQTETFVAGLLEWFGIPFTGSPHGALTLARAKHTAKHLMKGAGLPTADFLVAVSEALPTFALTLPVVVKPAEQDGSVGVSQASVCASPAQIGERVRQLLGQYGPPVLIEEYIPGREFNVALIELPDLTALPPTEIPLPEEKDGHWPILTYEGKWSSGAPLYDATAPRYPTDLPATTVSRLRELATAAYRLLGCRDYARVDFRMKPTGELFILEVNPNPEISPSAGFAGGLGAAQWSYKQFIVALAEQAYLRRMPRPV